MICYWFLNSAPSQQQVLPLFVFTGLFTQCDYNLQFEFWGRFCLSFQQWQEQPIRHTFFLAIVILRYKIFNAYFLSCYPCIKAVDSILSASKHLDDPQTHTPTSGGQIPRLLPEITSDKWNPTNPRPPSEPCRYAVSHTTSHTESYKSYSNLPPAIGFWVSASQDHKEPPGQRYHNYKLVC